MSFDLSIYIHQWKSFAALVVPRGSIGELSQPSALYLRCRSNSQHIETAVSKSWMFSYCFLPKVRGPCFIHFATKHWLQAFHALHKLWHWDRAIWSSAYLNMSHQPETLATVLACEVATDFSFTNEGNSSLLSASPCFLTGTMQCDFSTVGREPVSNMYMYNYKYK